MFLMKSMCRRNLIFKILAKYLRSVYNFKKIKLTGGIAMLKKAKKETAPATPMAYTVSLIGNKWKLLILKTLMSRAMPWHLPELVSAIEGLDQTVLKVTLQSMEKDGLVVSTIHRDLPPRIEYTLDELGESLRPVIEAMEAWGETHGH